MRQPIGEVRDLAVWGQENHFSLNVSKTKELIVDYRKRKAEQAPINIDGAVVEWIESFKNKLSWSKHQDSRKEDTTTMGPQIIKKLYSCTIEGILIGCITSWYGNCSAPDLKALQRVVRKSHYVTGAKLPTIQDLYTRLCQRKTVH